MSGAGTAREIAESIANDGRMGWREYYADLINNIEQAIIDAEARGRTEENMRFKVWGTDGCQYCETGRITMYVRHVTCLKCAHEEEP